MVIGSDFIWLHFPKCAGTMTETILRTYLADREDVSFDRVGPKSPVIWHDCIAGRTRRDPRFRVGNRRVIANLRRLPHWMISIVHFEHQRTKGALVTRRGRLLKGEYRARNGKIGKADRLAEKYSLHPVDDWVRAEHLAADLKRVFPGLPDTAADVPRANEGKYRYIRDLGFWFTPKELGRLYALNPVWAGLEEKVYGDVLVL